MTPSSKSYKAAVLKKGSASFTVKVKGAKGKVSYNVSSGDKKAVSVSKAGKVTVRKGTKKGSYKITVKAAGSAKYAGAVKTVTVKVK